MEEGNRIAGEGSRGYQAEAEGSIIKDYNGAIRRVGGSSVELTGACPARTPPGARGNWLLK